MPYKISKYLLFFLVGMKKALCMKKECIFKKIKKTKINAKNKTKQNKTKTDRPPCNIKQFCLHKILYEPKYHRKFTPFRLGFTFGNYVCQSYLNSRKSCNVTFRFFGKNLSFLCWFLLVTAFFRTIT